MPEIRDGDRWWRRKLRSKFSLRLVLLWFTLFVWTGLEDRRSGIGFVTGIAMTQMSMFAAEGLAVWWPRLFGRREHAWRRIVAAGRVFNDTGTGDDRA